MIRSFNGKTPRIAESAFVSEQAYVVGDVEIGEGSSVWPGAVIRGDFGKITVGSGCQIEDNAVLHTGDTLTIGNGVTIGHCAVVHCSKVGDRVLVGNNATLLDGAEIGDQCIIGANSVVGSGKSIPGNSLVVGAPARVKKQFSPEDMGELHRRLLERYAGQNGEPPPPSYPDLAKKYRDQGL